ncbi:hypothetical protein BW686_03295 [Pseudomonas syringae]|uniref:Uncharacterized protein n=1 Tax=Pseudomonas syringae TaxID=317 RepID=A0A244EYH5_PSESX|nr:hypothetical protein BW686_03295 [Pseudomonas syringae]
MFCHRFDLFTITVELAVNNLGVCACSPLCTRCVALWLNFDQCFRANFSRVLSTAFGLVVHTAFLSANPVDKSVNKRWKE